MGVDPGFASMGVAVIEWGGPGTTPTVLDAYVVRTTKGRGAALRVTEDDVRRMQVLWLNLEQTFQEHKPDALGVETYTVYKPTQGGHAGKGAGWKALYAYGMTCAMAFKYAVPLYPFLPSDLHRRVGDPKAASKLAVEHGVLRRTAGLDTILEGLPTNQHEHAADACGHALMALADHAAQLGLIHK